MSAPDPALARPTCVNLLVQGDEVMVPVVLRADGPVEYQRATVTRLDDDEPNRRIRVTIHFHVLDRTESRDEKPGELMYRVVDGNDPHSLVYVPASDLWKWEGAVIDNTNGSGKFKIIKALRSRYPDDGPEVIAVVVEDAHGERRPIIVQLTGGLFCEWN